jgi:hypothetical protein
VTLSETTNAVSVVDVVVMDVAVLDMEVVIVAEVEASMLGVVLLLCQLPRKWPAAAEIPRSNRRRCIVPAQEASEK